jgi:hypothetical protein
MPRLVLLPDPECPNVKEFLSALYGHPMSAQCSVKVLAELADDWKSEHLLTCTRCREHSLANLRADKGTVTFKKENVETIQN